MVRLRVPFGLARAFRSAAEIAEDQVAADAAFARRLQMEEDRRRREEQRQREAIEARERWNREFQRNVFLAVCAFFAVAFFSSYLFVWLLRLLYLFDSFLYWRVLPGAVALRIGLSAVRLHNELKNVIVVVASIAFYVFRNLFKGDVSDDGELISSPSITAARPPPPSPPPPPPPPPAPPSCFTTCLARAFHTNQTTADESSSALQHVASAASSTVTSVPANLRSTGSRLIASLGEEGSFARDVWPLLLLVGIVATVAIASVTAPIVIQLARPMVMPLVNTIRKRQAALKRFVILSTAILLLLTAAAIGKHSYHIHIRHHAYLRAVPYAIPISICLILARNIILVTPTAPSSPQSPSRRRDGSRADDDITMVIWQAAFVSTAAAAALFATASDLSSSITPFDPHPCVRRGWLRRRACESGCSAAGCVTALLIAGALTTWASISLAANASGSRTLHAVAKMPIELLAFTARVLRAIATLAARVLKRIAILAARFERKAWMLWLRVANWSLDKMERLWQCAQRRSKTIGGALLLTIAIFWLSIDGEKEPGAAGACAALHRTPSVCTNVVSRVYSNARWGPWPLTRLLLATWRDERSGSCARGLRRLCIGGLLSLTYGIELVAIDWDLPYGKRMLSGPVAKIRKILATPPPPPVHFVRDGVTPLLIGLLLLMQTPSPFHKNPDPPTIKRLYPLLKRLETFSGGELTFFELVAALGLIVGGGNVIWSMIKDLPPVIAFLNGVERFVEMLVEYFLRIVESVVDLFWLLYRVSIRAAHFIADGIRAMRWRAFLAFMWTKRVILEPTANAAYAVATACRKALAYVIRMLLKAIVWVCTQIKRAVVWLNSTIIQPTLSLIKSALRYVARKIDAAVRYIWGQFASLARYTYDCGIRLRRYIWQQYIRPALRMAWRWLIIAATAIYLYVLVPIGHAFQRGWPALSSLAAAASCYLFLRSGVVVLAAGAPSIAPQLLGATAAGSVSLLLAGEAVGSAYPPLGRVGAYAVANVDLGLISLAYRAFTSLAALLRAFGDRIARIWGRLYAAIAAAARRVLAVINAILLRIATVIATGLRAVWSLLLVLGRALRTLFTILITPLLIVWNSPAAALILSFGLLAATFMLHRMGAWRPIVDTILQSPSTIKAATTVAATATSEAAYTVFAASIAALKPIAKSISVACISAPILVIRFIKASGTSIGATAANAIDFEGAVISLAALHNSTAFAILVWSLLVAIVKLSAPSPVPPRAVAAAQLAIAAFCQSNNLRMLPVLLLVAAVYLRAAAEAAALQRRLRAEEERVLRETREAVNTARSRQETASLRQALEAAPKPTRVFSNESCPICLEDLKPVEGDEESSVTTLRCGHTFHAGCCAQWLAASHSARCPTCRTPITLRRSWWEGALMVR